MSFIALKWYYKWTSNAEGLICVLYAKFHANPGYQTPTFVLRKSSRFIKSSTFQKIISSCCYCEIFVELSKDIGLVSFIPFTGLGELSSSHPQLLLPTWHAILTENGIFL